MIPDAAPPHPRRDPPAGRAVRGRRAPAVPRRRHRPRPAARTRPATGPTSTSPPTPGPSRPRRSSGLGRRACGPGRALRDDRRAGGAIGPSRSRPTGPRPTGRTPASPTSSSPTGRDRPVPARLHGQRHGPRAARTRADRPVRRRGRSASPPSAHAAVARRVLHRRPAADDAGGPLHRRLRARARAGASSTPCGGCATGWRSCRPSGSATSSTSCSSSTTRRPGCGSCTTPGCSTSSCPRSRRCGWSRTRSTATRTCWPTRSRWSARWRPGGPTASPTSSPGWPRCCTTSASPRPDRSGPAG